MTIAGYQHVTPGHLQCIEAPGAPPHSSVVRYAITFALVLTVITTSPSVAQSKANDTQPVPPRAEAADARPSVAKLGRNGPVLLDVRVYDPGVMPAPGRAAALRTAAGALTSALIEVSWLDCTEEQVDPACGAPLRSAELSVRLARLPARPSVRGQLQLGYSLVDMRTHDGTLATVYVDRVEWLADQAATDSTRLLGFAVAHEIGHLLLGTNDHARTGLMRALWSRAEVQAASTADWRFSNADASAMRASLMRRKGLEFRERDAAGCPAPRDHRADGAADCGRNAFAALRGVAAGGHR